MNDEKGEIREFLFKIGKKEGGSRKYLEKGSIPSIVDNKQTITVKSLGKKTIGVEKLMGFNIPQSKLSISPKWKLGLNNIGKRELRI